MQSTGHSAGKHGASAGARARGNCARQRPSSQRPQPLYPHPHPRPLFSTGPARKQARATQRRNPLNWVGGGGLCVDKRFGNDTHARSIPSGGSTTPAPATSVGGGVVGRGRQEPLWKQIVDAPTHDKGKKHKAITHGAGVAQPKVSADLPSGDERLRGNIHSNVRDERLIPRIPFSRPSPILLSQGISPKFWFDPVTSVYRFVPTSPCVGSHPQLRTSGNRGATVRHVRTSRPSSASKPQLRDEVHRLTEGRVTTPRFRV